MKLLCLSMVIFVSVIHYVQSGILLDKVGDTLERIKCKTQSIGNRLFHRGQNHNLCDERQDLRPQGGHNQYEPFDNYNHQRRNEFQIWIPFPNREHGSYGQQNTNYNRGYSDIPNSNTNNNGNIARPIPNNQEVGSVNQPHSNNEGYGNFDQSIIMKKPLLNGNTGQSVRSTAKPNSNNVEYGYEHESLYQPLPTNQSVESIRGSSSSNVGYGNISQPSPNNQYSESTTSVGDGKREETTVTNTSNKYAGKQSQYLPIVDVRSDNNNQTGVSDNSTVPDGRRFLTVIKANCAAGQIADRNGVCREMYRR